MTNEELLETYRVLHKAYLRSGDRALATKESMRKWLAASALLLSFASRLVKENADLREALREARITMEEKTL